MADLAVEQQRALNRQSRFGPRARARLWAAGAVGALLFAAWAALSGWMQPVTAVDVEQQRLNVALPPVAGEAVVQSFRPQHDGLNEVKILLAQSAAADGVEGRLTMRVLDARGVEIAARSWPVAQLEHNQALALRFGPQANSEGQEYRLVLEGEGQNPFGAWAYDLNVHEGGGVVGADAFEGDLRFVTRYRLLPAAALQRLGEILEREGSVLLLSLLLLPLPGCLLLLATRGRLPALDVGAWWSLALALGLALWPLLWFWLTLAGGHWTRGTLLLALVSGWLLAIALFMRGWWRRAVSASAQQRVSAAGITHIMLLLLLAVALAARLLAVRDLAFPPWVDSSRHALITAVMVDSGQTPSGYGEYLAVDEFTYHFGFHTLAASVQMLGNAPLPRTLLAMGQLLNALAVLSVYGAAWLLSRRRGAALLAAFLVGIPFFFPAYYATWGRFTQLSGALLLAPLLALTWLVVRGSRGWRRAWWLIGLLAAGLFLVHVRVFLVYAPFAVLAWIAGWGRGRGARATAALGAAALWGLVLVGPRLWQLLANATVGSGYLSFSGEGYAEFPLGYVTTGWERWFLALGGLAFGGLALAALRGRRRALVGVALGGWAALVALLLSGRVPGVPLLWLINLNSAYILLFVPLALLLALGFAPLWSRLRRRPWIGTVAAALLGVALAACTLFGLQQQVTILNETTILAHAADARALRWVDEQLPPDARVAVNSWRWLGETWAAGDGGAWLLPLTGREPTTPPVDYIGDRQLFREVIAFNEGATAVEDWSKPEAAEWLVQQGVSHVFVGARGGFLDPAALARNPRLEMLYGQEGVFVFDVRE